MKSVSARTEMVTKTPYVKIVTIESVDSTNDYACALARSGAREITVVRAAMQTQGRGRRGREWFSPKNKGIYASFVLKPTNPLKDMYYLPLISSLAVVRLLRGMVPVGVKLPNDVVVEGKKISGVLAEAKLTGKKVDFAVVGIGVNVNACIEELPPGATSLFLETGFTYPIDELFRGLLKEMIALYRIFKTGNIRVLLEEVFIYQKEATVKKMEEVFLKHKETSEVLCLR
ncbi:MAG: biotin--[acetyl-CoA-carboxylase] ligase [Candidatus Omnitrophota bacterium]